MKNKLTLSNWIEIVGITGLILGLIFVLIELRQNSNLTNSELTAQFMTNWQEFDRSKQSEEFAIVYAKSITEPHKLTLTELIQLDAYYWVMLSQLDLARMLVEKGTFYIDYEIILKENVKIIFITPYSHIWWKENKDKLDSFTREIIDKEIMDINVNEYHEMLLRTKQTVVTP